MRYLPNLLLLSLGVGHETQEFLLKFGLNKLFAKTFNSQLYRTDFFKKNTLALKVKNTDKF